MIALELKKVPFYNIKIMIDNGVPQFPSPGLGSNAPQKILSRETVRKKDWKGWARWIIILYPSSFGRLLISKAQSVQFKIDS